MIFSIGHSTHSREHFATIARGMDVIVDVRSHPTSRWDQWRSENMQLWLPAAGFDYEWIKGLGGWDREHYEAWYTPMAAVGVDLGAYSRGVFPKQRIGRDRPAQHRADLDPPQWTNMGLYDYAWYTVTPEFREGLRLLLTKYARPDSPRAAILCCESVYFKCHRSMISDALWAMAGIDVLHLPPRLPVRPTTPRWKRHSEVLGNRIERYPRAVLECWHAYATADGWNCQALNAVLARVVATSH